MSGQGRKRGAYARVCAAPANASGVAWMSSAIPTHAWERPDECAEPTDDCVERLRAEAGTTDSRLGATEARAARFSEQQLPQCESVERPYELVFPPCESFSGRFLLVFPPGVFTGTKSWLAFPQFELAEPTLQLEFPQCVLAFPPGVLAARLCVPAVQQNPDERRLCDEEFPPCVLSLPLYVFDGRKFLVACPLSVLAAPPDRLALPVAMRVLMGHTP